LIQDPAVQKVWVVFSDGSEEVVDVEQVEGWDFAYLAGRMAV
jgi:hypothetical protein